MALEPGWKGIVKGKKGEYMIVEIAPDALGDLCLTFTDFGSREDLDATYKKKYGRSFVWPDPRFKIVEPS